MTDQPWKVDERKVARVLGGKRTPLSGALPGSTRADVQAGELYVEVKRRARFLALAWLQKARFYAAKEGKIGVCVVHVGLTRRWVVMLSLDDFRAICIRAGVIGATQTLPKPCQEDAE